MLDIAAGLLLLAINIEQECSDRDCPRSEQVEISRVVLHRAGSADYEKIRGVLFADKQFSGFNKLESRADTELTVKKYRESGKWPVRYSRYRGKVLYAVILGPSSNDHYRRCDLLEQASWSSEKWYTDIGWHHCFARPEHIRQPETRKEEEEKVKKAVDEARKRVIKNFLREKIEKMEVIRVLKGKISLLLAAMILTGCGGRSQPDFDYKTRVEAVAERNEAVTDRAQTLLKIYSNIESARIQAEKEIKLKKIEMAAAKEKNTATESQTVKPQAVNYDHCEEYRDEYPNQFALCLERAIEISLMPHDTGATASTVTVSGDNNTVIISSTGVDVSTGREEKGESGLLNMIKAEKLTPIPAPPVHESIADSWLRFGESALKAGLYGYLGAPVAKGIGSALLGGVEKDSVGGDYVSQSYNPVKIIKESEPEIIEEGE